MLNFTHSFIQITELANDFNKNIKYYLDNNYKESEVRKDFIDKFFIALGWDVNNNIHPNPYEREVKVEKTQQQQGSRSQKFADYAFYKEPNFKDVSFFVEAKKPSVELRNEDNYFQTIRYGWNAQTPIAVLTNFNELHIIDCRSKPDARFVFNGQHKQYNFTDFSNKEKFEEIYWLISREAVQQNSLIKFAEILKKSKGKVSQTKLFKLDTQEIDNSFLQYIDEIREELAKAFKKNDTHLNSEQLTEAVQRTIDRLVFIRFLEDKLIEGESHVNEWKGWKDFVADCRKLDAKYNGIVFKKHFIDEQNFAGAEEKMFKNICQEISSLNSPYNFNYIPIHILGSIYERFLGKVVIATDKRVHIDEKPEVRKAGGVYYTPKYIVDYIVKNTVGKLIDAKTPKEISELHFADIACGSGSFLIGVYDLLLDYHKKYYTQKLADKTELDKRSEDFDNTEYKDGQWVLTLKLKQQILLNNIYGVDIDAQAVEVTQLSLFLKMLEDESISSTQVRQGSMFSKVLPDLSKNIICGNSLIGFDIMQMNGGLFEDEELKKLNPMDYNVKFPTIMRSGGFDAIVGNPPYVDYRLIGKDEVFYITKKYLSTQTKEKWSLYLPFIEIGTMLLNKNGIFGYIVPNTFLSADFGTALRKLLLQKTSITEISDVSTLKVFGNVGTYPVLLFYTNAIQKNNKIQIANPKEPDELFKQKFENIKQDEIIAKNQNYIISTSYSNQNFDLINKIYKIGVPLKNLVGKFSWGTSIVGFKTFKISEEEYNKLSTSNKNSYKKVIQTADIKSYQIKWKKEYVSKSIYSSSVIQHFEQEKIVIARLTKKIQSTIDKEQFYMGKSSFITGAIIDNQYLIGVLNSKLLNYFFSTKFTNTHLSGGYLRFDIPYLEKLPIVTIDLKNKEQKKQHDTMVNLVTQMLQAKKQQAQAVTEKDKNFIDNKCQSLDTQIDNLVYELYGLTEEEIKIVEKEK